MIHEEILNLSKEILERHNDIKYSNIYEMSFIYDFWLERAMSLKITKRNDDYIVIKCELGEYDVEECEDEDCLCYIGCDTNEVFSLVEKFLKKEEQEWQHD